MECNNYFIVEKLPFTVDNDCDEIKRLIVMGEVADTNTTYLGCHMYTLDKQENIEEKLKKHLQERVEEQMKKELEEHQAKMKELKDLEALLVTQS